MADLTKLHNIYLVDDDEDDCFLTSSMLKTLCPGSSVRCIYRGEELLNLMKGGIATNQPGLIILDLNMPGLNGFETLEYIRQNTDWSSVPVIIFTTSARREDSIKAYELGATLFLRKPFGYEEFETVMHQFKDYLPS